MFLTIGAIALHALAARFNMGINLFILEDINHVNYIALKNPWDGMMWACIFFRKGRVILYYVILLEDQCTSYFTKSIQSIYSVDVDYEESWERHAQMSV